jgi:molecular chaperone HtpG
MVFEKNGKNYFMANAKESVTRQGNIQVQTDNIFPIIKKFLYSDNEIFLRELVSNATDAIQKTKLLGSIGEFKGSLKTAKVEIKIDKEAKTLTVSDNGIGMTAEEMEKYLNQVAFSGAREFLEKYKGVEDKQTIIGHFGLGFYSAFMVAAKVEVVSKSFQTGEPAHRWSCDGSPSYSIEPASRKSRGTDVILHMSEEGEEFLDESRVRTILTKYGRFF